MIFCPRCGTVASRPTDAACARCGAALSRPQVERGDPPAVRAPTNRGEALQRAAGVHAVPLPKAVSARAASVAAAGKAAPAIVVGATGDPTTAFGDPTTAFAELAVGRETTAPDGAGREATAPDAAGSGTETPAPSWGFPLADPHSKVPEGQQVGVAAPSGQAATAWPPPPRQWPLGAGPGMPTEPPPAYPPYAPDASGRLSAGPLPKRSISAGDGPPSGFARTSAMLRSRLSGPDRTSWTADRGEPPSYFWLALVCIFLFLPTGIAASFFSLLSTSRARSGDLDGSWRASRIARGLCIATIPLFIVGSLFVALGGMG